MHSIPSDVGKLIPHVEVSISTKIAIPVNAGQKLRRPDKSLYNKSLQNSRNNDCQKCNGISDCFHFLYLHGPVFNFLRFSGYLACLRLFYPLPTDYLPCRIICSCRIICLRRNTRIFCNTCILCIICFSIFRLPCGAFAFCTSCCSLPLLIPSFRCLRNSFYTS